jgi:hypothetical protein
MSATPYQRLGQTDGRSCCLGQFHGDIGRNTMPLTLRAQWQRLTDVTGCPCELADKGGSTHKVYSLFI